MGYTQITDTYKNLLLCRLPHRYIAWQVHEKVEGQYDFEGGKDFVDFTQLAGSLGLLVIIRAGKLNEKRDNIPHIPEKRRSPEFVSSKGTKCPGTSVQASSVNVNSRVCFLIAMNVFL